MFKKGFFILFILIFFAISFNVYIHEENIDDLAYIIAIGIDKGTENDYNITFQMSLPSDSKSSSNSSGGNKKEDSSSSKKNDTIYNTVQCKSLNSGLNFINNSISKRIDLSHCKIIIFSEDVAKEGISKFIDTLENNLELRSNCSILLTTSTAESFISNVNPIFENSTVSYYESIRKSSKYRGYTYNVTLNNFYTTMSDSFGEPCAMLCNTVKKQSNENEEDKISKDNELSFNGIAVFKKDKFIGELSPEETLSFLITTDNLKRSVVSIPSPYNENEVIDIHLSKFKDTKNNLDINNSVPYISSNVYLDSTIISSSSDFDANSSHEMSKLEQYIANYIKSQIIEFYNKISKEYNSDICGFGKYAVRFFPTEKEWQEYDWNDKFSNANFDVNVYVNLNTSYFIS